MTLEYEAHHGVSILLKLVDVSIAKGTATYDAAIDMGGDIIEMGRCESRRRRYGSYVVVGGEEYPLHLFGERG